MIGPMGKNTCRMYIEFLTGLYQVYQWSKDSVCVFLLCQKQLESCRKIKFRFALILFMMNQIKIYKMGGLLKIDYKKNIKWIKKNKDGEISRRIVPFGSNLSIK